MPGRSRGTVVSLVLTFAFACGGTSQDLPQQYDASQLDCLVELEPYCCSSDATPVCIPTFAAAQQCGAWPAGTTLSVYPTPCQGMTAIRVLDPSYSMFYVYDSTGALYAVGDNASTPDPRSGAIECGAGPNGFVIPSACADVWLGAAGAAPCAEGTPTKASICN